MKILICSEFFFPHIGGVEKHSQILANYFIKRKHKVHIATSFIKNRHKIKNLVIKEFNISGNIVKGYNGDTIKYQKFLINNKYDLIFFNAAQQWTLDLALPIIDIIISKKAFFPCGFSRLNSFIYKPYFSYLKTRIKYFDNIICANENAADYKFLTKINVKNIAIINNGAEKIKPILTKKKFIKKFKLNSFQKIICNISNIKYLKGQDRCIKIFENMKTNNAVLFLIGKNMNTFYYKFILHMTNRFNLKNKIKNKKIILINTTYEEARTILNYSDLFLFGSRTEYDPLVIYESIISKIKFVSFDVGLTKYHNHKLGFVSNDINLLISQSDKLLNNRKNNHLSNDNFLWKNIMKKYKKNLNI
jgi:glycosyltransferase involved in cell wall biosynthesis